MCTYNGEDFIELQIQSILDQTHTDFKLIIVDDTSNDRTVEIIKKMILNDKRIELHQNKKNLGYFNNFLNGLDFVKSDYLFFSDQDDIWAENKVEIQLADLMLENDNVLMNFSNSYLLFNKTQSQTNYETNRDSYKIKTYYSSPIELAFRNIVSGHTILIRSNQIPRIKKSMSKITDIKNLYFDYILTLVLLDLGLIKYINESFVYFRQHLNSTSTKMRMNYYKYISSNALAFSQISESSKTAKYFSILNKAIIKKSNLPAYIKLLYQNLIHQNFLVNNYDFYQIDTKPLFFSKIQMNLKLFHLICLQK
ncbi:glycosyltransferase [bacterium]|nr:glycosyltransferase [bacterium]